MVKFIFCTLVPIHNKNLQILENESFKVCNNIASPVLTEIFSKRNLNYEYVTHRTFQFLMSEVHIMELKVYCF